MMELERVKLKNQELRGRLMLRNRSLVKRLERDSTIEPNVQSELDNVSQSSRLSQGILNGRILMDEWEILNHGKKKHAR